MQTIKNGLRHIVENWKPYVAFIALAEGVGALAGFLTRAGVQYYEENVIKPDWTPPGSVFPVVWGILYALMGIGAARIWMLPPSAERSRSLILFGVQLAVNFFWSLLFFNLQAYGFAFVWLILLWILIIWMMRSFWQIDHVAALLQVPYLLWVTFAAYLNGMVWLLNGM